MQAEQYTPKLLCIPAIRYLVISLYRGIFIVV